MSIGNRIAGSLLVIGLLAGACGDDEGEETQDVEAAREALCNAGDAYVAELDQYGQLVDDSAITVGAARSGGGGLEEFRDAASAALADLDEANEAGEETETTVPIEDESRERVATAEEEFADAIGDIDEDAPLFEVVVEVSAAAFQLQVAWGVLLVEVDCLEDPDETLETFRDYVAAMQSDLTTVGLYEGPVDGIYGPSTLEAVRSLQADAGLPETGLLDRASQVALAERLGDRESAQVAALQGLLIGLGYWPPPADGVWTDELGDALASLQADLGLEPTGTIDVATLRALQDALATGVTPPETEPPATQVPESEPPVTQPPGTTLPVTEPPGATPPTEPITVLAVLEGDGRFTTLLTALTNAGLDDRFAGDDLATLFAPTDDAFAALPPGELDALLADAEALGEVLLGHTVDRAVLLAGFLAEVGSVPTAAGGTLTLTGPADDLTIGDAATVVGADLLAENGVVHAIDEVLAVTS